MAKDVHQKKLNVQNNPLKKKERQKERKKKQSKLKDSQAHNFGTCSNSTQVNFFFLIRIAIRSPSVEAVPLVILIILS